MNDMKTLSPIYSSACVALMVTLIGAFAHSQAPVGSPFDSVDVDERLGEMLPLQATFSDHEGATVTLGSFFDGERPVLITLNYYGCPMLCGLQLNALIDTLQRLDWTPGENFRIVTLSFDPDEGTELAAAKRRNYLDVLGRGPDVDWTFLTGDEANIRLLTDALGYGYVYVESSGEYAHPAVLMFGSPDGMIARYIYGLTYEVRDVRFALLESAEGRVGSTVDRLILGCFVFDPDSGSYVADAYALMRLGGGATVVFVLLLLGGLWSRDRLRHSSGPVGT